MPYHLDKGPVMTFLEEVLNGEPSQVVAGLEGLRTGTDLFQLGGVDPSTGTLEHRLRTNWLGQSQVTVAGVPAYVDQEPLSPADPRPTGYWKGYHGDVGAVLREALIRTAEVSLGLEHDEMVPTTPDGAPAPPRRWPVEVFWACPNPWFEAWITWRDHGVDPGGVSRGQVNLLLKTPGDDVNTTISDLTAPPNAYPGMLDPAAATTTQGMWVVSHARHVAHSTVQMQQVPPDSPLDALLDAMQDLLEAEFGTQEANPVWQVPRFATLWEGSRVGDAPEIAVVSIPHADGGVSSSV